MESQGAAIGVSQPHSALRITSMQSTWLNVDMAWWRRMAKKLRTATPQWLLSWVQQNQSKWVAEAWNDMKWPHLWPRPPIADSRKKRLLKSKKTKVSDISHLPGEIRMWDARKLAFVCLCSIGQNVCIRVSESKAKCLFSWTTVKITNLI
jgi:hypothetical protein